MGKNNKIITKLILFVIFIACTIVVMNRSVITGSLKVISKKRNDGTNVYKVSYVYNGGKWIRGFPYKYGYLEYAIGDYIG